MNSGNIVSPLGGASSSRNLIRIIPALVSMVLMVFFPGPVPAQENEEISAIQKAIGEARDRQEEARLRKQLGDLELAQDRTAEAAAEYAKAAQLALTRFTEEEQVHMATVISWTDLQDQAEALLRSILSRNAQNRPARLQLARVLSWRSRLAEAEAQADLLLNLNAADQEALVIKANVLRWSGDAEGSIPFYKRALSTGDHFDARLGLAYAYLTAGDERSARNAAESAKPAYIYQEKELAKFNAALSGHHWSWIGMDYSLYRDSDNNHVHRAGLLFGARIGTWNTELAYRLTDATDPWRKAEAGELRLTGRTRIGKSAIGAAAGIAKTDQGGGRIATGQVSAEKNMGWGAVSAAVSRDLFNDTAQLIANRIVRTTGSIILSERLFPSFTLVQNFNHSGFSDNNRSNDIRLTARYAFGFTNPRVAAGYQFRFLDFNRQAGTGYFDPEDFKSHQVFFSVSGEWNQWYASCDPYAGYQSFTRYAAKTSDFYAGFSAAAGWKRDSFTSLELNGEGGNYKGGAAAGYDYYLVGIRILVGL